MEGEMKNVFIERGKDKQNESIKQRKMEEGGKGGNKRKYKINLNGSTIEQGKQNPQLVKPPVLGMGCI